MPTNHSTGTPKASLTDLEVALVREVVGSDEYTTEEAAAHLGVEVSAVERIRAYAAA